MTNDEVLFEADGAIATVTFNRPEAHNAFNFAMEEGLGQAIGIVEKNSGIRVLIITGAGTKSFVSGSDIKELSKRTTLSGIEVAARRQMLLNRIAGLPIPVIAAINGYAFGIGCEIAMACTFRLAAAQARLGQLEINLGIIPGAGGTQRLSRLVGIAKAFEIILKGEIIDAQEACKIGVVNKVIPSDLLLTECQQWAEILCEKSPIAIKFAIRAILGGADLDLSAGLEHERMCLGACFASTDSKEGLNAFIEKRKPIFTGQ